METESIVGVVGLILSIATFLVGRLTASYNNGAQEGAVLTELGYLKSGIDDVKHKIDSMDKKYFALAERVTKLEEQVHIYHEVGEYHS